MNRLFFYCIAGLLAGPIIAAEAPSEPSGSAFRVADVFVDSHSTPLAAYQIEIQATQAELTIVGIEGGEHSAFRDPPFYDPKAIQQERLILAAFSTRGAPNLPKGKTRVATIHYQVPAATPARFNVKVHTAANAEAEKISIAATVEERLSQ